MSWRIVLVTTNIHYPTDADGKVAKTTIDYAINAGHATQYIVDIYAGNYERIITGDDEQIASGITLVSHKWRDEMTLHLMPYRFPSSDRHNLIRDLLGRLYIYVKNDTYPEFLGNDIDYYAVRILSVETEHKHTTGHKRVKIKIAYTRW